MKYPIIMAAIFCLFTTTTKAQHDHAHDAQSSPKATEASIVLPAYYGLKNALVASDARAASAKAIAFSTAIKSADAGMETPACQYLKDKLAAASDKIAGAKSIESQRTCFADLSLTMWELVKTTGAGSEQVYQEYCPMKKAYWLSKEAAIKNPYYGKQMLTCGKVTAAL